MLEPGVTFSLHLLDRTEHHPSLFMKLRRRIESGLESGGLFFGAIDKSLESWVPPEWLEVPVVLGEKSVI